MLVFIDSSINILIGSISFKDKKELIRKIRELKFINKEKDKNLCDELGVSLQTIISLSENLLTEYRDFIKNEINNYYGD